MDAPLSAASRYSIAAQHCQIAARKSEALGTIPQGFRRRFVGGRSRPTSANHVSHSEPAISAPYNHRQRHPASSSSTATSDPRRSPKPPDSRVDPGVSRFSGRLDRARIPAGNPLHVPSDDGRARPLTRNHPGTGGGRSPSASSTTDRRPLTPATTRW